MIRTRPYHLDRFLIAKAVAVHYLRLFWPLLVGIPAFGVVALIFAPNGSVVKYLGLFCVIWPLTIPGRAMGVSWKAARMLGKDTWLEADEEELRFCGADGKGVRLKRKDIYRVYKALGLFNIQTRNMRLTLVPQNAFESEADQATFEGLLKRS